VCGLDRKILNGIFPFKLGCKRTKLCTVMKFMGHKEEISQS
jgi:hypothetical protein